MRGDFVTLVESTLSLDEQFITEGLKELESAFDLNTVQVKQILTNKIEGDKTLLQDVYEIMDRAFNLPLTVSDIQFERTLSEIAISIFKLSLNTLDVEGKKKVAAQLDQIKQNASTAIFDLLFKDTEGNIREDAKVFTIPEKLSPELALNAIVKGLDKLSNEEIAA